MPVSSHSLRGRRRPESAQFPPTRKLVGRAPWPAADPPVGVCAPRSDPETKASRAEVTRQVSMIAQSLSVATLSPLAEFCKRLARTKYRDESRSAQLPALVGVCESRSDPGTRASRAGRGA